MPWPWSKSKDVREIDKSIVVGDAITEEKGDGKMPAMPSWLMGDVGEESILSAARLTLQQKYHQGVWKGHIGQSKDAPDTAYSTMEEEYWGVRDLYITYAAKRPGLRDERAAMEHWEAVKKILLESEKEDESEAAEFMKFMLSWEIEQSGASGFRKPYRPSQDDITYSGDEDVTRDIKA